MNKMIKDSNVTLEGFEKSKPRVLTTPKQNEGEARLYTKRGRLVLSPKLLEHFKIRYNFFELYFDKKRKLVALKFFEKQTPDSYKATTAKASRFIELRGPFRREELQIVVKDKPVVVTLFKNKKDEFLYFSYGSFTADT